ncbi:MAG: phenylacetate-CoA ligase [Paraglaciecola sp.]|jgi:phenylacetate-CoA ligase
MDLYAPVLRHALFPMYESFLRKRPTLEHLSDYESNLKKSASNIESIQLEKLHVLLEHCMANVQYYQNVFESIGIVDIRKDIPTMADLSKLPVLTKDIIRENFDDLIPKNLQKPNLKKSTGGSTGQSLHLEINYESELARTAVMYRGYGWLGAGLGVRTFYLWGATLSPTSRLHKAKIKLHEKFLNRKTMSSFDMRKDNLNDYVDAINTFKPTALVSYTDPLYQLAKYIIANKIKVHAPKTIITGAEALEEYQRTIIEKAFNSKVFNTYGCREVMLMAAECKNQKGFHINSDHLVVETVNEERQPVKNEVGDLLITDLSNFGMPLIRYQNGDQATLVDSTCSCGNPLPMMESISGRKADLLKSPDGAMIPGLFFPHLLKDIPSVIKFQVRQSVIEELELSIVGTSAFGHEEVALIKAAFLKITSNVKLNINTVDIIPLTPSGKHRVTICEI